MGKVIQFHVKDENGIKRNTCSFEIKNQTESVADLMILGDIVSDEWGKWCDDDTCPSDIVNFLNQLEGVTQINLHLNSGGGSVFAGISIYNMLKRHNAKVTTYIDGIAASIASVIACAGDRIVMPKNATFMIHKPSNCYFFTSLNADELRKDADTLDTCQKAILNTYMSKVKEGVTAEQITDLINAETWLVGEDVSDYFDFEIEESNQAVACTSDFYDKYKNTPKILNKDKNGLKATKTVDKEMIEEIVNKRLQEIQDQQLEQNKNDLLKDLDSFGK